MCLVFLCVLWCESNRGRGISGNSGCEKGEVIHGAFFKITHSFIFAFSWKLGLKERDLKVIICTVWLQLSAWERRYGQPQPHQASGADLIHYSDVTKTGDPTHLKVFPHSPFTLQTCQKFKSVTFHCAIECAIFFFFTHVN